MTGLDYTSRLIADISKSIEKSQNHSDLIPEFDKMRLSGSDNIADVFLSSLTRDVKSYLDVISQFINGNDRLVDHDKGDPVDLYVWERDISVNSEKISSEFQQVLDNDKLIDLMTGKPISVYLIQFLDSIHEASI
jgi:hypothetical protein